MSKKELREALANLSESFNAGIERYMQDAKQEWDQLEYDQRLKFFCYVVSVLKQAELDDSQSYRGVLYSAFGFDADAYVLAQAAGFLELHNAIDRSSYVITNDFDNIVNSNTKPNSVLTDAFASTPNLLPNQAAFPKAVQAKVDVDARVVEVMFAGGLVLKIPVDKSKYLSKYDIYDLFEVEISPNGTGLHFPKVDDDLLLSSVLHNDF